MKKNADLSLHEVGEFELLNNYILPLLKTSDNLIGDDCAFINFPVKGKTLVITTDAGPKPLFFNEKYPYYFIWGWYTVLANVSDLASTGCFPIAISLAVEAKPEMKISELMDYFRGVRSAAKKFGIKISGGNIKANSQFISNATAFGYLRKNQINLTRKACKPGDILVSVGDNGLFITAYLKFIESGLDSLLPFEKRKLAGPYSQLTSMQLLNSGLKISASSDNSDGVLGSVWNIAEKSKCGFELNFDGIMIPDHIKDYACSHKINPWNIFLFWGDWQVILTLKPASFLQFKKLCVKNNISYTVLGKSIAGTPKIFGIENNRKRELNILRNENFSSVSYNHGIKNHIEYLLYSPIYKDE
jgi:thiamine-monophosphate kinase